MPTGEKGTQIICICHGHMIFINGRGRSRGRMLVILTARDVSYLRL